MSEADAIDVARRYAWWRGWKLRVQATPRAGLLDPTLLEKGVPGLKLGQHPTWFIEFRQAALDGYRTHFRIDDTTRRVVKCNLPSVFSHLRWVLWAPLLAVVVLMMPLVWLIEFVQKYNLPRCPGCGQKTLARNGKRCASCGWRSERPAVPQSVTK